MNLDSRILKQAAGYSTNSSWGLSQTWTVWFTTQDVCMSGVRKSFWRGKIMSL